MSRVVVTILAETARAREGAVETSRRAAGPMNITCAARTFPTCERRTKAPLREARRRLEQSLATIRAAATIRYYSYFAPKSFTR
jgi:hypothetical protein